MTRTRSRRRPERTPTRRCAAGRSTAGGRGPLVLCGVLALAGASHAQHLIYFDEDGGATPRGLYTLDPNTGVATLRAGVGGAERFFAMCVRPGTSDVFAVVPVGFSDTALWRVDADTGATSMIGMTGVGLLLNIHFHPTTGTLYGVQRGAPYGVYEINPATGAPTFIAHTSDAARCGMVIDATGQAFGFTIDGVLSMLDLQTGATSLVGGTPVLAGIPVEDADFANDGALYFTLFGGMVYRVDPRTGANTLVHTTGMGSGLLGIVPQIEFCYPDCNADGSLTVSDFGCFQTRFVTGDPYADCNADGSMTVADFGCFQTKFVTGCP